MQIASDRIATIVNTMPLIFLKEKKLKLINLYFHIILQTESPRHHRLAIPNHSPLRLGTLNAILRAVADAKGIGKEDILSRL